MPRPRVMKLVPDAEDLIATMLDPSNEAAAHLMRYTDFLLSLGDIDDSGMLRGHIESTLLDLIALSLGARGEAGEIGRLRGLRAVNLQAILAQIKARFADPSFSARDVALRLGLTPRYVQNLLGETEANFTERVLELRLQKARAMLADPRHNRLKVSDIALACGFNEASYFNRYFRHRFGASPTQCRGSNGSQT